MNRSLAIPKENYAILSKTQQKELGNICFYIVLMGARHRTWLTEIKIKEKITEFFKEKNKSLTILWSII